MFAVAAVAIFVGLWWFTRTRELFVVSVRNGRTLLVRGRLSQGLMNDIAEIVASPPAARATVKAVAGEHNARLVVSGLDEGRTQRLRNTFGIRPVARLRAAPVIGRPTLGQILGIAWLAWLLDRRG